MDKFPWYDSRFYWDWHDEQPQWVRVSLLPVSLSLALLWFVLFFFDAGRIK